MTQQEIDVAVAVATGESLEEIGARGFSVADPVDVNYDPDPMPRYLDWDTMRPKVWSW